ncbi:MAG: hypothetical protein II726_02385 [Elusimicrobiaceae bacterium]|nr:hypothetical protein [Elusimicrobiaceae bacterium]
MANILRLFIVLVIFILGVIIGNVYLPQKNFDQKNIIVPQKPKASFNVDNVPSVDTVLKEADNYKNILIASGQDQEEIIGFENNIKRTVLQLYYKEAAANYSLELLKLQIQPEHTAAYIKAREEYQKIITLIETLYPLEAPKEVIVIKEENRSIIPSTLTLQNTNNIATSTETLKTVSTETIQTISSSTVQTVSTVTAQINTVSSDTARTVASTTTQTN